ncbi:hypothetical protein PMAL9190_00842 [Photobacterium malacitanum]|uniref:Uncharacterized protein n=1 Tax=Photobacterium malacitanum TaxID=2204294 RepID=A0A1Y6M926_9GAMM|nr:hypothetical protein [Photobacterium malacitanum]SMY33056.1 hypothetical protein PMAL9190_00842 [Photobacterium malacitanum]
MYESSFEIRLDYKPSTGRPDRVFLAMAAYVTAFENLTFTVGKSIDADLNFSYELSGVEIGSLKSIIKCKSGLDKVANALSSIPRYIANSMVDLESVDTEETIDIAVKGVENELLAHGAVQFPNQVNIDRYQYAKDIKGLCKASELLVDGETIDILTPEVSNVICLNTRVKFNKEVDELFIEDRTDIKKIETLLVRKPVFLGDSQWDFKSVERNISFSAPIEHKEWLERYQSCELGHLDPGDALIAFVGYQAIRLKGSKVYTHKQHRVMHIERVIKGKDLQIRIEEAEKLREDSK